MPSIEDRISLLTHKLITKVLVSRNKLIFEEVKKILHSTRRIKLKSTFVKCIQSAENLELPLLPILTKKLIGTNLVTKTVNVYRPS